MEWRRRPDGARTRSTLFGAMSRVIVGRFDRRGDRSSSRVRTRAAGSRGANPRRLGRRQDAEGRSMARGPVQTESGSLSTAEGERAGWISREESLRSGQQSERIAHPVTPRRGEQEPGITEDLVEGILFVGERGTGNRRSRKAG